MTGIGFGKIILFGEHFVVHGAPAIAGGISNSAVVKVKKATQNKIVTKHEVIETLSLQAIEKVLKSLKIAGCYDVHLEGDLPTYGGLGSSAAFCVALVRALAAENQIKLTNEEVNHHAYLGETVYHGNPSGVDNTIATHGGIVEFRRGATTLENKFSQLSLKKTIHLVVTFTGKYSPTVKMVDSVRKFREQDPNEFSQLLDEYNEIYNKAKLAITLGNFELLGQLMNQNQNLLSEIGVSDELNEQIVKIALEKEALGSKVTGGGGGGCCISLVATKKLAEKLCSDIESAGFKSFVTEIK